METAQHCPIDAGVVEHPQRSRADLIARRVLFVKERPAGTSKRSAERAFQRSMLISATRCTLTYIIFPFVLPLFGIARSVGPALGLTIGSIALVCDVFAIRRFFAADHKYRWHFTVVALMVVSLLFVLLIEDIASLLS